MLDTQMPRNSQRDGKPEPALVDKDKAAILELKKQLEQAQADNVKLKSIVNEVGHYFKQHDNHHYNGDKLIALAQIKEHEDE